MNAIVIDKLPAKKSARKPAAPKGATKAKADPTAAKPDTTVTENGQAAWNFPTAGQMDAAKAAEKLIADATAEVKAKGKRSTTRKAADKAPSKPAAEKKAKETVAAVAFIARKAKPGQVVTVLQEKNGRPTLGVRLFAHTHAALTILGMLDAACPAAKMTAALNVMGHTAVTYHLKENNFMRGKDDTISLTTRGYTKFRERNVDGALANAYVTLFLDGKITDAIKDVRAGQTYQVTV